MVIGSTSSLCSCQFSLYPLGVDHLSPILSEALKEMADLGLTCEVGNMSTVVSGPTELVFQALEQAFGKAAEHGGVVLVATVSNACPV